MSSFGLILEKLEFWPYIQFHLWSTLDLMARNQIEANRKIDEKTLSKIIRWIQKSWSRLAIRAVEGVTFQKNENMVKMTKF